MTYMSLAPSQHNGIFSPSGAETRIFWENQVNSMAADGLAPCVTRWSATVVLTMHGKHILVIIGKGFQLPEPSWFWEVIWMQISMG